MWVTCHTCNSNTISFHPFDPNSTGPNILAWAEAGGAELVSGLEVLVRQGALSFERWTGRSAPLDAMRRAARASSRA